jgi:hypothetical protein
MASSSVLSAASSVSMASRRPEFASSSPPPDSRRRSRRPQAPEHAVLVVEPATGREHRSNCADVAGTPLAQAPPWRARFGAPAEHPIALGAQTPDCTAA